MLGNDTREEVLRHLAELPITTGPVLLQVFVSVLHGIHVQIMHTAVHVYMHLNPCCKPLAMSNVDVFNDPLC